MGKTRIDLDIWVDDLNAAIGLVRELGGSSTGEMHLYGDGSVVVMCATEGNEFCLVGSPSPL